MKILPGSIFSYLSLNDLRISLWSLGLMAWYLQVLRSCPAVHLVVDFFPRLHTAAARYLAGCPDTHADTHPHTCLHTPLHRCTVGPRSAGLGFAPGRQT